MDYNYHSHTYRCNHATGTPEEYIRKAIENGIKYMGFSDHFPYICRDGFEARYRVPLAQVGDYFDELCALREKYKNEIEIKIGFELEYYPEVFSEMLENAKKYGAEYLILGQHFIAEEHPNGVYCMNENDSIDDFKKYVSNVIDGIKTGVFTYIAHPDLFNYTGSDQVYENEMRKICIASREYNVPLEINFLGLRQDRIYPDMRFWKIAAEEKSPTVFGFDSHDENSAFDGESLKKAQKMVGDLGLNYIGRPKYILI